MRTLPARWDRLPFIGRLLVTTSLALLLAGAAMITLSASQEADEIQSDLRAELSKELETLPAALAETIVVGDFATLQQALDRFVARPLVAAVTFQDLTGARLNSKETSQPARAPAWFATLFKFSDVMGSTPVVVGGRRYGELHVTLTAQELATRAWSHLVRHLEILLLALMLDFFGIWLVLRQGMAPLAQLEAATQALAGGNIDIRLTPHGSPELITVMAAFNRMAEAVSEARSSLNHERRRLAHIIEGTHVGTWEWNIQTGATDGNPRLAEIVGYTLDELAPISIDTWAQLAHPDDLKRSGELLKKHFAGELPYFDCEARLRHKAGHWVWIQDRGQVVERDASGQPTLMVGTHMDISDRKAAELLAQQLTDQLRFDEKRSRDFSISASDWFWETDSEHHFCYFSNNFENVYGLPPKRLLGNSRKEILEADALNPSASVAAHLAQLDEHLPFKNFDYQVRIGGGQVQWVSVSGRPHFDTTGQFLGYRGTGTIVTERKQAEVNLHEALQMAQAANQAKSRFLATMSHEIRTPMNGILGMAQMLLIPKLTSQERDSYARTILGSGQSLMTLLNDILDLSKIEAGKFQLDTTVFEPADLIHETQLLFSGAAKTKQLIVEDHWHGPQGQRYEADSHRLRQMLSNLLGNAIKFTHQGQIRVDGYEIEVAEATALLEFSVSDSGVGIAADKLALLFKPFSQTDSSTTREFGGSGLGLSIVHNLAQAMGGEVGVESEPGRGSRFWFRLPVKKFSVYENTRRTDRPSLTLPTSGTPHRLCGRVLVAEDNLVNRMVIESLLHQLGLVATLVNDGQQVVDAVTHGTEADVILMDLHMPVMDGYTATEQIRQWEATHTRAPLPIIALTADAFEEDRQHCMAVGMNDFLTKPITIEALQTALTNHLPPTVGIDQETPRTTVKQVDLQALAEQLDELTPLLEKNMFDAHRQFRQLENLVVDTPLAMEVEALAALMQNMQFESVLARLKVIATTHTPPITPTTREPS